MLLGLALIAIPLLVAIVNAALQIRKLAETSQEIVLEGVQGARLTQSMFADVAVLERSVRLYQLLGDAQFLDNYSQASARIDATLTQLATVLTREPASGAIREFGAMKILVKQSMANATPNSPALTLTLSRIGSLDTLAGKIATSGNQIVDLQLAEMQRETERAQRRMFWQSALLAPLTLIAILALTLTIGRPLRAIDRAISELGQGNFANPIQVAGPVDLQRLGGQLEWLRQRLHDLAEERNRFLRHMSHELKTPLANIREGTELLMDGAVGHLDNNQREVIAILRDNGIKLQRLIENLLSYSAWQKESVGLDVSDFRLRLLVKQVLESQQLTVISQRVRLDVKIDDLNLRADRGKMRLIIENLLSNAIKYSPKGGTIYLHAAAKEGQLRIDVADSGPGIPKADRARIFDAFYTGKAPTGGFVKGTGIGLSVVLEFVNAHGGTVEIVDGVHPGAHFRLNMPVVSGSARASERAHAA
jgi:two-component system sensor histidine kinase GlrK